MAITPDTKPWVYWFWLNGNITRAGITADLEAMARVGIGGVLIMEVDQGAPVGPVYFASDTWRELFRHAVVEADRLGLQVNMNNDAGWCGSGGMVIVPAGNSSMPLVQASVLRPPMFIAHEPHTPSRHERRKANVGSTLFLIQTWASRTIGPQSSRSTSKVSRRGLASVSGLYR